MPYQPTLFETQQPYFDNDKSKTHGKIFVLTEDVSGDGRINIEDLQWQYLEGDGDFRSKEIRKLRDEADIIITNPPFSLFREFVMWLMEVGKQFIIIGNMNAVTYKEIFPLIKDNKMWLGNGFQKGNAYFRVEAPPVAEVVAQHDDRVRQVNTTVPLRIGIVGRMGIAEHVVAEEVVFIYGLTVTADSERA